MYAVTVRFNWFFKLAILAGLVIASLGFYTAWWGDFERVGQMSPAVRYALNIVLSIFFFILLYLTVFAFAFRETFGPDGVTFRKLIRIYRMRKEAVETVTYSAASPRFNTMTLTKLYIHGKSDQSDRAFTVGLTTAMTSTSEAQSFVAQWVRERPELCATLSGEELAASPMAGYYRGVKF